MKRLIWLSLIAVGIFALACSSAPTAAPAVPQAPVTKAAPGRATGQTAHINMAASQVDALAGFPNEAAYGPQWVNVSIGLAECLFVR